MGRKVLQLYVADPRRDIQTLEYYRLNKIFMRLVGQWPFSPLWQQYLGVIMYFSALGNLYLLEVAHFIMSRNNMDELIECFAPLMINTGSFIKLTALIVNAEAVRELFTIMQNDWNIRSGDAEKRILEEYANRSKFLTLGYMFYMYFTMSAYLFMPLVPFALNAIQPLNESRPRILPSHAEYFVIKEPTEHYLPLFLHQSLGTLSCVTNLIVCDGMFATYAQHACGIFAILKYVSYQLEHLADGEEQEEETFAPRDEEKIFAKLVYCIEEHKKAIKFAEFIENTYNISNLLNIIISMVSFSFTGVQTVIHIDHMETVMRFGVFTVGELFHLFFISLPGQAIHDHSSAVFHAAYNNQWYAIPKKSRDLLKLIMIRSKSPCQLTAGNFYVMDLERFSAVAQTSMSYLTVLCSMR